MAGLLNDLSHALRGLMRAPRFAFVMCAILGVGIGASVAVWSALYAVVLDRPPVAEPGQLRIIERTLVAPDGERSTASWLSYPVYRVIEDAIGNAADVAAFTAVPRAYGLSVGDLPAQRGQVEFVSGNYFGLLGVGATHGRTLIAADDIAGASPTVVLAEQVARALFGDAGAGVGRIVRIDGYTFEVVGVTPADFAGLSREAVAFTTMVNAPTLTFANRLRGSLSHWHQAVIRPHADATPAEIAAALGAAATMAGEQFAGTRVSRFEFASIDLQSALGDPNTSRALWVAFGGVVALLLLACVNAANLSLMRGVTRAREFAVRTALGANRGRLLRGHLIEGLLIGSGAAAVAVGIAAALFQGLRYAAPEFAVGTLSTDWRLVATASSLALVTILVALVAPALARADLSGLRKHSGSAGIRRGLVAAEVALATVLIVGAGLMVRSAWNLSQVDPGYASSEVLIADVALPRADYRGATAAAFHAAALERVGALPGVEASAFAYCPPPQARCDQIVAYVPGRDESIEVVLNQVSAGYFETLRIPLLGGRPFGRIDGEGGAPVAVISKSAAVSLFGDVREALGKHVRLGVGWPADDGFAEVVGVVGDVIDAGLASTARPLVYTDWRQLSYGEGSLLVRSASPAMLRGPVSDAITSLDPAAIPWNVRPLAERLQGTVARERIVTALLTGLGLIALVLAVSGVFAMLGLAVEQRNREFGVRKAVGARPRDVFSLVLRDGAVTVAAGSAVGLGVAFVVSSTLQTLLFGVQPNDPMIFIVTSAGLFAAAIAGAALPAMRAASVDPMDVLRDD